MSQGSFVFRNEQAGIYTSILFHYYLFAHDFAHGNFAYVDKIFAQGLVSIGHISVRTQFFFDITPSRFQAFCPNYLQV